MKRYFIREVIHFAGEVEAESKDEALAVWQEELDITTVHYNGVESQTIEELDDDEGEDGPTLDTVLSIVAECLAEKDGKHNDGHYLAKIDEALAGWKNSQR